MEADLVPTQAAAVLVLVHGLTGVLVRVKHPPHTHLDITLRLVPARTAHAQAVNGLIGEHAAADHLQAQQPPQEDPHQPLVPDHVLRAITGCQIMAGGVWLMVLHQGHLNRQLQLLQLRQSPLRQQLLPRRHLIQDQRLQLQQNLPPHRHQVNLLPHLLDYKIPIATATSNLSECGFY